MSLAVVAGWEPAGAKPGGWTEEEGGYTVVTTDPATGTYHGSIVGDSTGAGIDIPVGPLTSSGGKVWVGMAVLAPSATAWMGGSSQFPFLWISDSTSSNHVGLCLLAEGSIAVGTYVGAQDFPSFTTFQGGRSVPGVWVPGEWFYLEFAANHVNTTGFAEVRVNGQTLFTTSALDSYGSGTLSTTKNVRIRGPYSSGETVWVDDLYVEIEDGAGVQDFHGPSKIQNGTPSTLDAAPAGTLRAATVFAEPMSAETRLGTARVSTVFAEVMSSPSPPATAPDAVTDLAATPGDTQVALAWSAPADGGAAITDYVVEVDDGGGWVTFADGTSATTGATVTGLSNGVEHSFRVSAVNSAGTGTASNVATATPTAASSGLKLAGEPLYSNRRAIRVLEL